MKTIFLILAVGPGARTTREGAIGSNQIKKGDLSVIDDWAGSGGLGSRLLQHHGIAGIVFGGDWHDPAMKEARELDEYFLEHFGKRAILSDLALSEIDRYVPKFETGGAFVLNMHEAEMIYLSVLTTNQSTKTTINVWNSTIISSYSIISSNLILRLLLHGILIIVVSPVR